MGEREGGDNCVLGGKQNCGREGKISAFQKENRIVGKKEKDNCVLNGE